MSLFSNAVSSPAGRMTWIEAVNLCLSAIGEAPVNTLEGAGADANHALAILNETNRAVQAQGWHFNTKRRTTLNPQPFAPFYIYVPTSALAVDTVDEDSHVNVVATGGKLFNINDDTFEFDRPLVCTVTLLMDFTAIPAQAQQYIAVRAARVFQARTIGSSELHGLTREDEAKALYDLKRAESRRGDYNVLTDNSFAYRTKNRLMKRRY